MDGGEPGPRRRLRAGEALSDEQSALLVPLIPPAKPGGRPRATDMRRLLDGLFYLVRTGCQWRHLPPPPAFPPWRTIYGYMRAFADAGVWESIRHHLVMLLRERDGREPSPSAAIVDTQSVKTTEKGGPAARTRARRSGAGSGTSRSTPAGLLLGVIVHAADVQDADGVGDLLRRLKRLYPWLRAVFADGVYDRLAALLACFLLGLTLIVVRRLAGHRRASSSSRAGGWRSGRSAGSAAGAGSPGTTRSCPRSPRRWSSWR